MLDIRTRQPGETEDTTGEVTERGRAADGSIIELDRRLYVQLLAFTGCADPRPLVDEVRAAPFECVLYADVNDPRGCALLTFAEDPAHFVAAVRPFVASGAFGELELRPHLTMLGRTYSIGYESDLEETLLHRPRRTMLQPDWPWAIWYPLRRSGRFEQLPAEEQRRMLMEHGGIGRAFGRAGHAHDVRLACHGLGTEDNDFIAGIVGPTLTGPSAVVQRMRRTQQTSLYLEHLGPFFVGRTLWQSPLS